MWELYDKGREVPAEERYELGKEIWKILIDEVWTIGIAGQVWYHPRVLNNQLANAAGSWCVDGKCRYPRLLPPGAVVLGIVQGHVAIDRLAPGRGAPAPAFSTCRE